MTDSLHELIPALQELGHPRIAVVGDFMLDRYLWGDAGRVSPEAPVPVVHAHREEDRLGGAGNVVANLIGLGAEVACFGALGDDASASQMIAALGELDAATDGLQRCADRPTIQKIRVMARNQQMLRVDREESHVLDAAVEEQLLAALRAADWDAVVLSDYGKGTLSEGLTRGVLEEAKRRGKPSLVDPKHRDFARYRGATLVTPNRLEAEHAAGVPMPTLEELASTGERLRADAGLDALLITLGAEGMFLMSAEEEPLHLPTAARQVYDVTGAGDTVIATLAIALGHGFDFEMAVRLANASAGLAVAKVGTTAVGREELLHMLRASTPEGKILGLEDADALQAALSAFRLEGRRIVFTNGCFDILHAGHVRYLRAARGLGDVLVLGLNSDASVRRLKGEQRPFNPLEDRAEVLAGLECVDLVVPFTSDTPEDLIQGIQPDVLVKGGDWRGKGVAGAEFVERHGGEVQFIDLLPGRSTTGLADRIRNR
ncbi:MAG: bifunctional D-glycero-beta-D-manno-heptose-7-phosphate kinase/D-glycero-beta-D-manno-heptose 1-phosphate adenylyltransferase HldE [Planctomycetota bacterium]|jgi:D-beta-D-heptose 7-phosphate kinase/D-beta-D-heptose 1-phosphate adenosyltransferase